MSSYDQNPPGLGAALGKGLFAFFSIVLLGALFLSIVLFVFFPGVYASKSAARRAIENAGFTDVQMGSNHWIFPRLRGGCGDEDTIAWEARVKNAQGQWVWVTACGTLFWKNYTIRINK